MNSRQGILFLVAAVAAICIALLVRGLIGHNAPETPAPVSPPASTYVLVAARDIAPGEVLGNDMVAWQPWPKANVSAAYFTGDGKTPPAAPTNAMVARTAVLKGQPLMQNLFISGERGSPIAAALSSGMRAVTIPVSMTMAIAGFLQPGDHVDILLTQNLGGKPVASVALADARVLAVDQAVDPRPSDGKTTTDVRMVTFELPPDQAKVLVQAQAAGTLSLILRPLKDGHTEGPITIVRGSLGPGAVSGEQK